MEDHTKNVAGVREGDLLAGKYRIERILGAGGMGVVVAARHIHLDDRVAIKFLLPETLNNAEAVSRFGREARAAVKIKSEHVARVADVGTLENGAPYMVMEYLDGSDLSDWLKQKGALNVEQASEFVLQASEAIAEAHSLGIVHRDLKPANLFVVRRPDGVLSVKVLDFGISKVSGISSMDMTKTSAIMGSPLYMSPEQMQSSKDVDPRSDIWAIGVILYELLSGDSPFMANTMPELIARILSAPPEPIRSRRPDAPAGIEAVIMKCLERDRTRRFQNIGELSVALLPYAPKRGKISVDRITGIMRGAGIQQASVLTAGPPSEAPVEPSPETRTSGVGASVGAGTAASWGRTAARSGSNKAVIGAVVAGLAVAAVGAVLLLKRSSSSPDANAPQTAAAVASPAPVVPSTATPAVAAVPPPSTAAAAPVTTAAPTATAVAAPVTAVPATPSAVLPLRPGARPSARHPGKPEAVAPPTVGPAPAAAAPALAAAKPAAPPPTATKPNMNSLFDDRQ